jgi:hypothetical protein
MQFKSGKNSKGFVGTSTANVELPITGWAVNPGVEKAIFRNSKTGAFSVKETTFLDCSFSITVDYDLNANPYISPNGALSLLGGGTFAAQLYINGSTGANWSFPSAILEGNPQSVTVEGKVQTQFNFSSNGSWVEPAV